MDDEYFGTLGGSLMKDLLADLQVDDNDWSIEQLEKELESYEKEPMQQPTLPSLNAASLVVNHSQQRSSSLLPMLNSTSALPPPGMGNNNAADAWSVSLQKFASLSLEEDFLKADSARKQSRPPPGMPALAGAEDYDITQKQVLSPPPGLGGASQTKPLPTNEAVAIAGLEPKAPAPFLLPPMGGPPPPMAGPPPTMGGPPPPPMAGPPPMPPTPHMMPPPPGTVMPPHPMGMPPPGVALPGVPMPPPGGIPTGQPMPPPPPPMGAPPPMGVPMPMPMNMPPPMAAPMVPITGVVVGSAVSTPGQAWQTPPPMPQPEPQKIFCNPYPRAPPIPATELISSCMTARDIAYVIHAILKPVLAAGTSENDYYIQYIKRRVGGPQADPVNPKRAREATHDVKSRATKSKEWASEKSVLGHVTKSNVARPRALIATPQQSTPEDNKEQRQRANLWKARVYCDQAYQAYQSVIDIWRASDSSKGIPPQVQMHLVKLKKCMGIVLDKEKKEYVVSDEALKLIAKLEKGRTLIARVLEQALLPPNAVHALLPPLLDILLGLPVSEEPSTNRLFQAITGVIPKLSFPAETLVRCLDVALGHGKSATGSIVRMGCLHSLLQKGAQVVPQDPSPEIKEAWGVAERKFMSGLQLGA
eukprot:CAMPEP_0116130274 /NCGR_PEP_ID=MMETSP0329-20121206/8376_1 /TAXON_ID=697910 /ORGANISM="Pseudo-nitzschia arenysensis, Strain B593" /LENGTH=643 /DNA_ID=CAMNT_0003624609 /DNA_START=200 /DNA_END=2131 /DNA_ORIENTATION=+